MLSGRPANGRGNMDPRTRQLLDTVDRAIAEWKRGVLEDAKEPGFESRALSALPAINRFCAHLNEVLDPHPLLFACSRCTKSFVSKRQQDIHIRSVHSVDSRVECAVCGKVYRNTTCLRRHENTHRVECVSCRREFSDETVFDAHNC